jgi:hypothetical protein
MFKNLTKGLLGRKYRQLCFVVNAIKLNEPFSFTNVLKDMAARTEKGMANFAEERDFLKEVQERFNKVSTRSARVPAG